MPADRPADSNTLQINPADTVSGYDINAAGQTRIFYGAASRAQAPNVTNDAGDGDHLQLVQRVSGLTFYNAMLVWKASDFLTTDRELETITIRFESRDGGTDTRAQAFFILQTSDGWYRSNESSTEAASTYKTWTANVGDLTWSSFSEFGVTGGGAVAADTTDINSIGYYTAADNDNGELQWFGSKTIYFEVAAVPEPSSTALLGLGGLALILRRRK